MTIELFCKMSRKIWRFRSVVFCYDRGKNRLSQISALVNLVLGGICLVCLMDILNKTRQPRSLLAKWPLCHHAVHFLEKSRFSYGISEFVNLHLLADPTYPRNPKTFGQELRKKRMDLGVQIKELARLVRVTSEQL